MQFRCSWVYRSDAEAVSAYNRPMGHNSERALLRVLAQIAPGTPLREGLDRVLQSGRGGLIVVGDSPEVLNICSGGFLLDSAFTPQRLAEVAKMDGAIILDPDATRIARANVHLVPNPNVPTTETGTRHRTAERVARSLDVAVVAVSQSRKEIQIYISEDRHSLEPVSRLLERSNQAIQTLERYRSRLASVAANLSALEVENLVTLRDVVEVLQRTEMVARIAKEIERNLIELGSDGRLVRLQLEELMGGVIDDRRLLIRDYFTEDAGFHIEQAMDALAGLSDDALFNEELLAKTLHLSASVTELDGALESRGYRLLSKVPRLTATMVDEVVDRFENLDSILGASAAELQEIAEDPDRGEVYRGVVKVKLGAISTQFKGDAHFVEKDDENYRAVLKGKGRDTGGRGNASADITAHAESLSPTSTKVVVTTDLHITGKVAQFGRGILGDVSTKLIDQFADNLNTMIDADGMDAPPDDAPEEAVPAADPPAPDAQAADAAAPADAPDATEPESKVRKINGPAADPTDLMDVSGSSILKRAAPAIAALLIILFFLRRRS